MQDYSTISQIVGDQGSHNQGFNLVWAGDIVTDLSNDYLIKNLLDRGSMSVVYGESNSGKSFFAIDMAMMIASGTRWRNRNTRSGIVLYVAAESPKSVERRVKAMMDNVSLNGDPKLVIMRDSIDLLDKDGDTTRLIALCKELEQEHGEPVEIVILDTLARSMAGGNENSFEDMSAVVGHGDEIRLKTGAHVMYIHHSGKDAAKGARGHSSLKAATDTEIEVRSGETNGAKVHTAEVIKQRDHEIGEQYHFSLKQVLIGHDQDGDPVTTCVVEKSDVGAPRKSNRKATLSKTQKIALKALEIAEKREKTGDFIPLPVWRDDFYSHHLTVTGNETDRFKWRDAWNPLVTKGSVELSECKTMARTA